MKKQIIALSILLAGLTSCEKDDKTQVVQPKPKTKTELLVQKVWDLDKVKVTTKANGVVLFDQEMPLEGTVEFKKNNTGVSITPEEGTETFKWELRGDTLVVDGDAGYILTLNETKLELLSQFSELDSTMGQLDVSVKSSLKR